MDNKKGNLLTSGEKITDLNGNEHIIEKHIGGGGQGDTYSTKDPSIALKINKKNEYQLVLVPRHLERIKKVEDEILKLFPRESYSLLSDFEVWKNLKKTEIVIVDKMGVLTDFYQMADFVFVGGTLVNIGGHSILEPLFYGRKPIIGKYFQNIEEIVNDAKKLNFVEIVQNEDKIIDYLKKEEKINTKEFFEKNNEIDKIISEIF